MAHAVIRRCPACLADGNLTLLGAAEEDVCVSCAAQRSTAELAILRLDSVWADADRATVPSRRFAFLHVVLGSSSAFSRALVTATSSENGMHHLFEFVDGSAVVVSGNDVDAETGQEHRALVAAAEDLCSRYGSRPSRATIIETLRCMVRDGRKLDVAKRDVAIAIARAWPQG